MKLEKITEPLPNRSRSYADACAAAHALDLVGERWALLVMRELMLGPKRFSDLRLSLPGISANVLTQRLEGLEGAGVLRHRTLAPPAAAKVYELTEWGYEAEPIFQTLGRWAARSPAHDPGLAFSTASLILSLRTMFDAGKGEGFKGRIGLRIGGDSFLVRVKKGRIQIVRGDLREADCVLSGEARVIAAAVYGGQTFDALEAAGGLTVTGERPVAAKFVRLFPLPEKAPVAERAGSGG